MKRKRGEAQFFILLDLFGSVYFPPAYFRYIERNALRAGLVERAEQWRWGSLWRWMQRPKLDPKLLTSWPIPRSRDWVARVNTALTVQELKVVRRSIERGSPLGKAKWIESIVRRLHLESSVRPQGRPKTKSNQ